MSGSGNYKTRQRQAILDFLMDRSDTHVTVGQISEHLESTGNHVGTTTIYRHIDKLLEQGLVRKYTVDGTTSACFQYSGQTGHCRQHFHLKCEKCGKLIHLECDRMQKLCEHIYEDHGFSVDLFRTVLYGICSICANDAAQEEKE